MKRLTLYALFILIIISLLYACIKDEISEDKEAPVISDIRVGAKDTIIVTKDDGTREIVYINTSPAPEIDTLILGLRRRAAFSVRFTDDYGLSSYRVTIAEDSTKIPPALDGDTVYYNVRSWGLRRQTDTIIVNQQEITLTDSLRNPRGKYLPIREGIYRFIISCIDLNGNETENSVSVNLLYPETIIADRN